MLLGHARGKVGSVVFSRLNGKQITRALAEQVKNPRTDGQNAQRAIFATVTTFAASVRDVVDHSFQSLKEGQESVNRFISINTKKLREAYLTGNPVDIMPKGEGLPYANIYRMSQGSLGLQRLFLGGTPAARKFAVYSEDDWEGNITDAALLKAILPAFAPGCEVAVIKVYYNEDEHYHYVRKDRAVFLSSFEGITGDIVTANGIAAAYLDPNKTTDNKVLWLSGGSSGTKYLAVSEEFAEDFQEGDTLVACAVIVSQQIDGKWNYTTSDMMPVAGWNDSHSLEAAIASYGNSADADKTSDLYLQQSASQQQEGETTDIASLQRSYFAYQGNETLANQDGVTTLVNQELSVPAASTDDIFVGFNIFKGGNEIKETDVTLAHSSAADASNIINRQIFEQGNVIVMRFNIKRSGITEDTKWLEIKVKGVVMARFEYNAAS